MTIFRDSINNKSDHSLNDEEKIDDIISEINNFSYKQNKKTKYWIKYIKQQKKKSKKKLLKMLQIMFGLSY